MLDDSTRARSIASPAGTSNHIGVILRLLCRHVDSTCRHGCRWCATAPGVGERDGRRPHGGSQALPCRHTEAARSAALTWRPVMSVRRSATRMTVAGALTAVAVLLLAGPAQAATLVANYKMGGTGSTMTDSSGRGHTGTLHNVTVQQPGLDGMALGFLGKPSYITVPASADFTPGTGNYRVQLSVKFSSKPSASVGDYDLLRMGLGSTSGGDYKLEILGNGKAYCEYRGSSGTGSVTGGPVLSDNKWHTLVCARTASSVVLTVDGATFTTAKKTGNISSSVTLFIGARDTGGGDQYKGIMDSVSISKG